MDGPAEPVLEYCRTHPYHGPPLTPGGLDLERNAGGALRVIGLAPEIIALSTALLALAAHHPLGIAFRDGHLTFGVDPPLRYIPLYLDRRGQRVICRRAPDETETR